MRLLHPSADGFRKDVLGENDNRTKAILVK